MAIIELLRRAARPLVGFALLSVSAVSFGAVATPQITQAVNNQQRVTLHGNVRPLPAHAQDLGAVAASMPAGRVMLLLKRPAAQEAALEQFLSDAHTPGAASYHQWLTPTRFGSEYGPADSDIQAVVAWLQSQGFAVAKISPGKTSIEFSGTAGQIQSAFVTQIHSFNVDGETHINNITDPQIPAALAPVIAGVSPLNDFRMKPMHTAPVARTLMAAPTSANAHAMVSVPRDAPGTSGESLSPEYTFSQGGYFLTPGDIATIYDTPNQTLNKKYAASANLTGTGVTIGIAGDSNVDLSNVANYRSLFGLPALTPTVTIDGSDPGVLGDDSVEALLDLEMTSAVAPGANLTLYIAQDTTFQAGLFLAIQRALDENAVNILNVSFGACEAAYQQAGNQQISNFWQQAAAQGISVTVSTGDSGAAACDSASATTATQGLQVNALASTPYDIAVGGTDFNQNTANIGQYWSSTNSTTGESALSYIPEIPWNDSTKTIGSLAGNVPLTDQNGNTQIAGAGGGVSGCLNPVIDSNTGNITSCTGAYAKPSWQSAFGTQNARELPDVSLFASDGAQYGSAYLICASGLGGDKPGDVDCTPPAAGAIAAGTYNTFQAVGGTSAAAPAFAGMLALVIQQLQAGGATNVRLGQADYTLYPLSQQHPSAFHDVTTGNNSVVCTAGSLNCGANSFLTGYDAGAGYDLASGLGSVDATQMVQNWSAISFKPTTAALQLNGSTNALSITHGTAVTVAASVSSSGGTPTGNVVLVNNNSTPGTAVAAVQNTTASPSVFTLSNGAAGGPYSFFPGGTYTVKANYGGDGIFGSSVSNGINITVAAEPSTLELSVAAFAASNGATGNANGGTFPYGTWISVAAQPVGTAEAAAANPPIGTGTVTFTGTAPLNATATINSTGFAEFPGQTNLAYPLGAYSVSASYSGDPSFSASKAAAQSFTITKANVSLTYGPNSGTGAVTVEVDNSNANFLINAGTTPPTGIVTVTNSSGVTVGSGQLASVPVTGASVNNVAQVNLNLDTTKLAAGPNTLNVTYPGDGNYNAGGPATIVYTLNAGGGSSFAVTASPTTVTLSNGGSASTTVSVTPQGGFTGTVSLACAVAPSGGPTCSFATPSVAITSGPATDTLTVNAGSGSSALHMPASPSERTWYTAGRVALAGVLLLGLPGRRRAWQRMLSLMLLIVATGVIGCGGGSSSKQPATYQVTVTATSGNATPVTTTINVTVN